MSQDNIDNQRASVIFGWLMVIAIALHGPVDLIITASYPHLESNPVVLWLGWVRWLTFKTVFIAVAALIWLELQREEPTHPLAYILAVLLTLLGVGLILSNLLVVTGTL